MFGWLHLGQSNAVLEVYMRGEVLRKMREFQTRRSAALETVARVSRPLVSVLKDHKLDNTASELSAALFELDVADEELRKYILADPKAVFDELLGSLGGALNSHA